MSVKHLGKYKSFGHMIDGWECSCGWQSAPYFDGADLAEEEFARHVKKHELVDADHSEKWKRRAK